MTTRRRFIATVAAASVCALPQSARAAEPRVGGAALTRLLTRAKATHSDGLTVLKGGELVLDYHTAITQPIETMSVTMSIVSLAIGMLIDDGKLTLETAAATFYPQWRDTPKAAISIRHLVGHTSGIVTTGAAQTYSAQSDFVRYALGMELNAVPGTLFAYNPLAYSLLPDIVRKVSRKPIDSFLAERLFGALGIDRFYWLSDAAKNRLGMSGLHVGPRDLATIGQLLVARGAWRGRQIISQRWLRAALQAQSRLIRNTGLFWWLIYERSDHMVTDADIARWRAAGIAHKLVDRVAELDNQPLATAAYIAALRGRLGDAGLDEWTRALASAHTAGASLQWGKLVGCSARGNLGQYLLVYPAQQLVIARMISSAGHASDDDGFDDIFALGAALAGIPRA